MQLRTTGGVPRFIMLKAGEERIFSVEDPGARGDMLGNAIDRIRFVSLDWGEIAFRFLHQLGQIRLVECFDPSSERGITKDEDWRTVFARDLSGFDGNIEAILDRLGRKNDSWTVAVSAVDRLEQI